MNPTSINLSTTLFTNASISVKPILQLLYNSSASASSATASSESTDKNGFFGDSFANDWKVGSHRY